MYKLIFDKKALRELNKLEKNVRERLWGKLQDCKEDPLRFFEKLTETAGFKLRVGDWRLIADINRTNQTINILKVGHRKNIYKNDRARI